jgi:iron complex outermembrane receptor protein
VLLDIKKYEPQINMAMNFKILQFQLGLITALLLTSFLFQTAKAQESNDNLQDTVSIEEVVITGSKAAVNRNQVPLTVSVISNSQIESQTESALLPIINNMVPGLFVTERGVTGFGVSTGSAGGITIRGIGNSPNTGVLILLNGSPQYVGIMGHPLPDAYRSANIERVEIIRGPASSLYGSNAMGGVINIITKEQKTEGVSANANLMYGSYQTFKAAINGGFMHKGFSVNAGINHDESDGHRPSSDFNINDGYFKTGYQFNKHFKLTGDMSLARFKAQDPGKYYSDTLIPGEHIDIKRGMGSVVFSHQFARISGSFHTFYNFGEHTMNSGFHSTDFNRGIMYYESLNLFTGNTITLGVDYKNYGGMAENTKAMNGQGVQFVDTTMNEAAGYMAVQQDVFKKVTLNGSIRNEWHEAIGNQWLPSAGIAARLTPQSTIRLSASKGFRNPTIRELYIRFPWPPRANPDLKPEKSYNYEAGIEQRFKPWNASIEVTLFYIKAKDMIGAAMNENNVLIYMNLNEVENKGVELSAKLNPVNNLWVHSNYSFIDMKEPVLATPTHKFNLMASYTYWKIDGNISYQLINKLYTITGATPKTVNYQLVDLQLGMKIMTGLKAYLKCQNLFDEKYEINDGYPMPGRCWFAGISYALK